MFRKTFFVVLVFALAFMATGCRLVNPSGSSSDSVASAPSASVKVVVPVSIPAVGPSSSIRAQLAGTPRFLTQGDRRLITGATVTVAGQTLTESTTNPGHYEASIARSLVELGFVVRATAGRIALVNIVTRKEVENKNDISAPADENTTTFAEVAKKASGMADYDDLIEKDDEVEVDLDALKQQVTDTTNTNFQAQREAITTVVNTATDDDLEKDPESEGSILDGVEVEVPEAVIPVRSDEDIVRARGQRFVDIVIAMETEQPLTDLQREFVENRLSDSFMHSGTTKEMVFSMLGLGAGTSMRASSDEPEFVSFDQEALQLKKLSDDAYLVGVKGVVNFTGGVTEQIDALTRGFDFNTGLDTYTANSLNPDDMFPILIKKEAELGWMVYGNGIKAQDININLNYQTIEGQTGFTSALWMQLDEGEMGPSVSSIEVIGGQIEGTVELGRDMGQEHGRYWYYMVDGHTSGYSPESWKNLRHPAGGVYTFKVTYEGGAIQNFKFTVPAHTDIVAPTGVEVSAGETAWTVTWPQANVADFENYLIALSGAYYRDWEVYTKSVTSYEIPFPSEMLPMNPGITFTVNTRRGVGSQYYAQADMPMPITAEDQLQSMLTPLDEAFKGIATTADAAGQYQSMFSGAGANMRANAVDVTSSPFPEGTLFHALFPVERFHEYFEMTDTGDNLNNLFELPATVHQFPPVSLLLMALYDSNDNEIPYPLTTTPMRFEILTIVDHSFGPADVLFWMHAEELGLVAGQDVNFNEVRGKIDVNHDAHQFTIKVEAGSYDASADNGFIASADVISNGKPLWAGDEEVVMHHLQFNKSGLVSVDIVVGDDYYRAVRDGDNIVVTKEEPR